MARRGLIDAQSGIQPVDNDTMIPQLGRERM